MTITTYIHLYIYTRSTCALAAKGKVFCRTDPPVIIGGSALCAGYTIPGGQCVKLEEEGVGFTEKAWLDVSRHRVSSACVHMRVWLRVCVFLCVYLV